MSDELREALAEAIECIGEFVDVFGNEWRDGTPLKDRYNAWKAALATPSVEGERAPQGNCCTSVAPQPAYAHAAAASNLSARAAEARLEEVGWWRSRIDGYDELFDGRIAELESAIGTPSKGEAKAK